MSRQTEFRKAGSNLGSTIRQSMRMIAGKDVPNYTLVFLDPTTQHSRGESKNIVMPYIVLGRGGACNIQYGDEYGTVSRQHCSIQADQEGYSVIHNPQATNPTLVDGKPVSSYHRLQSGDEIQLSYEGPKIRFLTDRNQRTSTMGFTRRMSVALAQSMRPYRRALAIVGILLVAAIGYSAWSTYQIKALNKEYNALSDQISLSTSKIADQEKELAELSKSEPANSPRIITIRETLQADRNELAALQQKLDQVEEELEESKSQRPYDRDGDYTPPPAQDRNWPSSSGANARTAGSSAPQSGSSASRDYSEPADYEEGSLAGEDMKDVLPFIYQIKVLSANINEAKLRLPKDETTRMEKLLSDIRGTGFLANDGKFITSRNIVLPWLYGAADDPCGTWARLGDIIANSSGAVDIKFEAYSPKAGHRISFTYNDSKLTASAAQDVNTPYRNCSKTRKNYAHRYCTAFDANWIYHTIENKGSTLEFDRNLSADLYKSEIVHTYSFPVNAQTMESYNEAEYAEGKSSLGLQSKLLPLSGIDIPYGSEGAPVFIKRGGKFIVIGVLSHSDNQRTIAVPVRNIH